MSTQSIVIVGGGASIRAHMPKIWEALRGLPVMAVNHAFRFLAETPRWLISMDRKFWKDNAADIASLEEKGCEIVNRDNGVAITKEWREDAFFCGQRKLSGVFALSYATRVLEPARIFLFGFDFGPQGGKTHFYDEPRHSGQGKDGAYVDKSGAVLPAVRDFELFLASKSMIYVIGPTNITPFRVITFDGFLNRVGDA